MSRPRDVDQRESKSPGLRVLHVTTSIVSGGAGLIAADLNDQLNRTGRVMSAIVSGRGPTDSGRQQMSLDISTPRLIANVIAFRLFGAEGPFNVRAWRDVWAQVEKADLIHLHNAHGYYLPRSVLQRMLRKPVVWTLHDFALATGRRGFPPVQGASSLIDRILPFVGTGYPAQLVDGAKANRRWITELLETHRPVFTVPTGDTRQRLLALGFPSPDIQIVPHGLFDEDAPAIDKGEARRQLGWPEDQVIVLFASNILDNPIKGFDLLLKAWRRLTTPQNRHLYAVGRGGGEDRSEADITFTGALPAARMKLAMAAADIFVSPTYDETFGLTVLEAMGAGTRVVCSGLPVLREVTLGLADYFEVGSLDSLTQLLSRTLAQMPETNQDRLRYRFGVLPVYGRRAWADTFADIYADAVRRKGRN